MRRSQGFSLIEILVVLFVIVVIAGIVSLNVNSGAGNAVVEESLNRLRAVAEYARDEAQFRGQDFGVLFVVDESAGGEPVLVAHWRMRTLVGWRPMTDEEAFAAIIFPEAIDAELTLDGLDAIFEEDAAAQGNSNVAPQWQLLSSGETQTGELMIRDSASGDLLWRLEWDALGRMQMLQGEDTDRDAA